MSTRTLTTLLALSALLNVFLATRVGSPRSASEGPANTAAALSTHASTTPHKSGESHPFIRVVDGDTVVVGFSDHSEYVRLIGIDSPEPNDPGGPECYATEATAHLRDLARSGTVALFFDPSQGERDTYGRLLAYVKTPDGTDLGERMVRDGYAREYTYDTEHPYEQVNAYRGAEREAAAAQRGLWAPKACVAS